MKIDILGVKVDKVNMDQAVELVEHWMVRGGKHYIVSPNIEFIMLAQKDQEFRKILNNADLAIPDSSRFGWAQSQLKEKNPFLKLLKWPLFLFPQMFQFDVVTGVDLMEELVKQSCEKGFTVGFLGGRGDVAVKLKERLIKKYPNLKVSFADNGGEVNDYGDVKSDKGSLPRSSSSLVSGTLAGEDMAARLLSQAIPPTDILFVAFGHIKQEKWIAKNIEKYPVKVMMGVGGAFDYLSGDVPRAPVWIRKIGMEWLFRLILQPWRIKRFKSLIEFLGMLIYN